MDEWIEKAKKYKEEAEKLQVRIDEIKRLTINLEGQRDSHLALLRNANKFIEIRRKDNNYTNWDGHEKAFGGEI